MTVEPLSSNVVNYLVWRYLQEAGYGNAALHLSRCWIRDPQTLPFARDVQPHTLVNLLQDGLWFDKLQAEAANVDQRYHFGRDHGQPYSVRNGALLTLDQGIPAHELAEQANGAVQEPPPKKGVKSRKKAKPNGVAPEPRAPEQVNGDAMDIDANGANHVAPSVNSMRAESEPVASEADSPTVADIPISTLSIGQSTDVQTEVIADLAPNTIFIPNLRDPERVVEHTSWGPPEAPVLLTAGKSLLNIQVISKDFSKDAAPATNPVALKFPMEKYTVTALCWISGEDIAVSAREEIANETGEKMMIDKLVKITEAGDDYQVISSTAGLVNTLRWNKEKEMLLSISTDGERGSIKIWKNHDDSIPAWAEFTDTAIFDALWISDSTFVVCGIELFKMYEIDDTLKVQRTLDTRVQWETLKFEPSSGIIAALGTIDGGSSVLGYMNPHGPHSLETHQYPDEFATDLDFRNRTDTGSLGDSSPRTVSESSVLLATCSMTGPVRVWDASAPSRCLKTLATTDKREAFKVAFSPDGALLAAAGPDAVTIWDVDRRDVPIATCRTREWGVDKWNPGVDGEFSLGWDPDGSKLSVALGNQIAIIPVARRPQCHYVKSSEAFRPPWRQLMCDLQRGVWRLGRFPVTMAAVPSLPEDTPLVAKEEVATNEVATNGVTNDKANGVVTGFRLHDGPVENFRPIKVIVIGAGYSGIYHSIRIPERLRSVELVVYEKNAGVGGTWYENRYLGCACDIPSHSYQYTFEPNHDWSSLYAPAHEIQAYLERTAKKYSADRFIKLSHEVVECRWNDAIAKWNVTVKNLTTGETIRDQSDVLISARGNLNTPAWPSIDGFDTFKGEVMHSARWNEEYDFTNKRIGVIGAGSSSIQIVPSLQCIPGTHVSTFVRSKTWISPSFGHALWEKHGFEGFTIPPDLRKRFAEDPEYYAKFRLAVEEDGNGIHAVTIKGTPLQLGGKQMFTEHMKQRLGGAPHILDALLPSFSPGCRRLTPGPGYLEALTQPNVAFVTSNITQISENAIHTADGRMHEVDALVCATGFHTNTSPPFPVIGSNGLSLKQKWSARPTSYLSHSISSFPNFFTMLGANSAIGSGSLTCMIENVGDYVIKAIRKIQKEDIAAMSAKADREKDFTEYADAYFEGTVFAEECNSWYKSKKDGKIVGLWPGSTLHCVEAMRSPRWEDYEYVYREELPTAEELAEGDGAVAEGEVGDAEGKRERIDSMVVPEKCRPKKRMANRMKWLGNGWSANELEKKDLAWYLYKDFLQQPVMPRPEENEVYKARAFSY
ncbi:hypothetical protein P171DRAFT_462358 [Karstenula rhodostoma CBS 690.94]|uniref:FAD/NAD(P)-binding domain-containing protein n=1 Tax=Karstenula rhodostoma CBS 690.94 TaxID=1392251 RepID=A0A9P4PPY7_9PLEO|nr:hypothetical protein P171DRAFT_462358 [Karstenula rhodostoma CBS 690.94]